MRADEWFPARNNGATSSFRTHARVVHSLVLRDIQTRTGGSYFGFLFGLVMPLGHIGLVLALYVTLGRKPAIGTDTVLFLTSAILPFIIWSYTHQKMIAAFSQNQALMSFPIVGITEISVARAIVELLTATLVSIITLAAIWLFGSDLMFHDNQILLLCFFLAYLFGISTGFFVGVLSILNHFIALIGFLLIPLFWVTCGVLFIPDALPEMARKGLYFFAIAHIVEFVRMAVYPSYYTDFPSIGFIVVVIVTNLMISFLMVKFLRVSLTSH